jgi:hypothetical protein
MEMENDIMVALSKMPSKKIKDTVINNDTKDSAVVAGVPNVKDGDFVVDIDVFKKSFHNDPLQFHLKARILDCKKRREAYWEHYSNMRYRNNLIGIPLLVLSSGTGVTSIAQIHSTSKWLVILTTILGVTSAFITSLQRYMRYSERAEQAKYLAKNYGRIARKIEDFMIFIESKSSKVDPTSFNNFIKEMHKDIQTLTQEADDMPRVLRCNPAVYNQALDTLYRFEWEMRNDKKKKKKKSNTSNISSESDSEKSDEASSTKAPSPIRSRCQSANNSDDEESRNVSRRSSLVSSVKTPGFLSRGFAYLNNTTKPVGPMSPQPRWR